MTQTTPTGNYGPAFTNGYGGAGSTPTPNAQNQASPHATPHTTWGYPWNQPAGGFNPAMTWAASAPWNPVAGQAWNRLQAPFAGFSPVFDAATYGGPFAFTPTSTFFNPMPWGGFAPTPYGLGPIATPFTFGYSNASPYVGHATFNAPSHNFGNMFGAPWNANIASFNTTAMPWSTGPWTNPGLMGSSGAFGPYPSAGFTPSFAGFNPFTRIAPQFTGTPANQFATGGWTSGAAPVFNPYIASTSCAPGSSMPLNTQSGLGIPVPNPFNSVNQVCAGTAFGQFNPAYNPIAFGPIGSLPYGVSPIGLTQQPSPLGLESPLASWAGTWFSPTNPVSNTPVNYLNPYTPALFNSLLGYGHASGPIAPVSSPLFNQPFSNVFGYQPAVFAPASTPWNTPTSNPFATSPENLQPVNREAA